MIIQDKFTSLDAHHDHDLSDWPINIIPLYVNATGVHEGGLTRDQAKDLVVSCMSTWNLRAPWNFVWAGFTSSTVELPGVVFNWGTEEQIVADRGTPVNGFCRYHMQGRDEQGKWIMGGAEIWINAHRRAGTGIFARGTVTHEGGHANGIHGHVDGYGNVMSTSSSGRTHLTLDDVSALDSFNMSTVELCYDMDLTCPVVVMGDGSRQWVHCNYLGINGRGLHTWKITESKAWRPPHNPNNVRVDGTIMYMGQDVPRVRMSDVVGLGLHLTDVVMALVGDELVLISAA